MLDSARRTHFVPWAQRGAVVLALGQPVSGKDKKASGNVNTRGSVLGDHECTTSCRTAEEAREGDDHTTPRRPHQCPWSS
jgi:hypothetical protein